MVADLGLCSSLTTCFVCFHRYPWTFQLKALLPFQLNVKRNLNAPSWCTILNTRVLAGIVMHTWEKVLLPHELAATASLQPPKNRNISLLMGICLKPEAGMRRSSTHIAGGVGFDLYQDT